MCKECQEEKREYPARPAIALLSRTLAERTTRTQDREQRLVVSENRFRFVSGQDKIITYRPSGFISTHRAMLNTTMHAFWGGPNCGEQARHPTCLGQRPISTVHRQRAAWKSASSSSVDGSSSHATERFPRLQKKYAKYSASLANACLDPLRLPRTASGVSL